MSDVKVVDTRTAAERAIAEVGALVRARVSVIVIQSQEERRIEREILRLSEAQRYPVWIWDSFSGITGANGATIDGDVNDALTALARLRGEPGRRLMIFRDVHRAWTPDGAVIRGFRSMARLASEAPPNAAKVMIVLTPSGDIPPELAAIAAPIVWPTPDRAEIGRILDSVISGQPEAIRPTLIRAGERDRVIDAAMGLSGESAEASIAHSIVTRRVVDPPSVAAEKKRLIRGKGIEWIDPSPLGLDGIGGNGALKRWALARRAAFTPDARAFGLPAPKGCFLYGPPGTGKTETARALAVAFGGLPLLKFDPGATRSKWLGESEGNVREAFRVASACAPCVLLIDEVEKGLAGSSGPAGDGGVAADLLGTLLGFMNDSSGGVFVVATANEIRSLPPEFTRKGRFDEVFFVDLPGRRDRVDILRVALARVGRSADGLDLARVADVTDGFSGAELSGLIPDALMAAFSDGKRPLRTDDLLSAASVCVPVARGGGKARVDDLRTFARSTGARSAADPEAPADGAWADVGRSLDMGTEVES